MRTEEQIRADMVPFQAELEKLKDVQRKAEHKALLGKCFKYHNSYGGDRSRWWLYAVVTGGEYSPRCFTFQTTSLEIIEIRQNDQISSLGGSNYIEISRKEFDREWRKVVARIRKFRP